MGSPVEANATAAAASITGNDEHQPVVVEPVIVCPKAEQKTQVQGESSTTAEENKGEQTTKGTVDVPASSHRLAATILNQRVTTPVPTFESVLEQSVAMPPGGNPDIDRKENIPPRSMVDGMGSEYRAVEKQVYRGEVHQAESLKAISETEVMHEEEVETTKNEMAEAEATKDEEGLASPTVVHKPNRVSRMGTRLMKGPPSSKNDKLSADSQGDWGSSTRQRTLKKRASSFFNLRKASEDAAVPTKKPTGKEFDGFSADMTNEGVSPGSSATSENAIRRQTSLYGIVENVKDIFKKKSNTDLKENNSG